MGLCNVSHLLGKSTTSLTKNKIYTVSEGLLLFRQATRMVLPNLDIMYNEVHDIFMELRRDSRNII